MKEQIPRIGIGVWVIENGRVLLGRRKASLGEDSWAPPGGHLEWGEHSQEGAKRELLEETGLKAIKIEPTIWTDEIHPKAQYISLHYLVTEYVGELKLMEPDKCYEWVWFQYEEIPKNLFLAAKNFIESDIFKNSIEASQKSANI